MSANIAAVPVGSAAMSNVPGATVPDISPAPCSPRKENDMSYVAYQGRCPTCGHNHSQDSLPDLLATHSAGAQEPVVIMDAALTEICNWPDGGSRYGQGNIMRFAKEKLDKARRARFNAHPQPMPDSAGAREPIYPQGVMGIPPWTPPGHGEARATNALIYNTAHPQPMPDSAGAREPVAYTTADRLKRIAERDRCSTVWHASIRDEGDIPLYTHPQPMPQTDAARDVLAERARQVSVKGWTPEHDDAHCSGQLAIAAGWYALNSPFVGKQDCLGDPMDGSHEAHRIFAGKFTAMRWPWTAEWWKPTTPRRDLVKAAALILAEIERLDRAKGE